MEVGTNTVSYIVDKVNTGLKKVLRISKGLGRSASAHISSAYDAGS